MLCSNAHNRNGTLKTKLENLHNIFLNSDFSLNISSIFAKFLENVFYSLPEGSVSQNFDLGPSYFFMLCRNLGKLFFHYYLRFPS